MLNLCNCTLDFMFPTGDYQQCAISDFKCLNKVYLFKSMKLWLQDQE